MIEKFKFGQLYIPYIRYFRFDKLVYFFYMIMIQESVTLKRSTNNMSGLTLSHRGKKKFQGTNLKLWTRAWNRLWRQVLNEWNWYVAGILGGPSTRHEVYYLYSRQCEFETGIVSSYCYEEVARNSHAGELRSRGSTADYRECTFLVQLLLVTISL